MTPVTYVRASVSSHSSGGRLRQRYDQNPAADPRSSIGRTLQWVPGHGLPRSDPGNGHACICERTIEWQLITAGIAWIRGLAEPWRLKEATMGTHAMTLRRKETTEHVPRGRRGRLGLAPFTAATLVSLALLAPSTASAFVTIGSDLSGPGTRQTAALPRRQPAPSCRRRCRAGWSHHRSTASWSVRGCGIPAAPCG